MNLKQKDLKMDCFIKCNCVSYKQNKSLFVSQIVCKQNGKRLIFIQSWRDYMIELHELTPNDGEEVFKMVQDIGEKENGFINSLFSSSFSLFQEKLRRNYNLSKGINLEPNYVPQTIYWLFADGKPVGYGKLRHYLNESLLQHGGHIGYVISPNHRGNGYAKKLLEKLLKKSNEIGINQVLLTTDYDNSSSQKVIEHNNEKLEKIENSSCFYWIDTFS